MNRTDFTVNTKKTCLFTQEVRKGKYKKGIPGD